MAQRTVTLTDDMLTAARKAAIEGMQRYSLKRAVEAEPDYTALLGRMTRILRRIEQERGTDNGLYRRAQAAGENALNALLVARSDEITQRFPLYEAFIKGEVPALPDEALKLESETAYQQQQQTYRLYEQARDHWVRLQPEGQEAKVLHAAFDERFSNGFRQMLEQIQAQVPQQESSLRIYMAGGFATGKTTFEQQLKTYEGDDPTLNWLKNLTQDVFRLEFPRDVLSMLDVLGYQPGDKHKETFWFIRPVMAGCHSGIDQMLADMQGVHLIDPSSLTPSVTDDKTIQTMFETLEAIAQHSHLVVIANYLDMTKVMARGAERALEWQASF